MTDHELLHQFVKSADDRAFEALVARHLRWMHASALRQVKNAHLADDVVQSAFIVLARRAHQIRANIKLSGWLFNTLRHCAMDALKLESRRKSREQKAAAMKDRNLVTSAAGEGADAEIALHLDSALASLGRADRDILLLRFFEEQTHLQVAKRLGISEEAARKRVSRGLNRLERALNSRGAGVSQGSMAPALAAVLTRQSIPSSASAPAIAAAATSSHSSLVCAGAFDIATKILNAAILMKRIKLLAASVLLLLIGGGVTYYFTPYPRATSANTPPVDLKTFPTTIPAGETIDLGKGLEELVNGIRQNRANLKQAYIVWSLQTDDDGFMQVGSAPVTTRGTYQMWIRGDRIATKYDTEIVTRWVGDPDGAGTIGMLSNRSLRQGYGFSTTDRTYKPWKPRLGKFSMYESFLGVLNWEEHQLERLTRAYPGVERSTQRTSGTDGRKQLVLLGQGVETGGASMSLYEINKGWNLSLMESYNPEGRVNTRETRKIAEPAPGFWLAIDVDMQSIEPKSGKVTLRNHFVVDMEKSSFNDQVTFSDEVFNW